MNMKNPSYFLLQIIALAMYFFTVAACHKDHKPTVVGQWETVQAFGYKWEHEFKSDGQSCRRSPEAFGETAFCYDYQFDNVTMTMTIETNDGETWKWDFVCDDVADVTVTASNGEIQRLILKKTN